MLEELGLEQCKLFVCEWNCSLSNRSFINDSCYRSAWLTHGVSRLCSKVDLLSVCMGSDWVDNYYDNFRIVNGNMGMVSQYNVRKPAFFAMQFLKSLGDFVIERREHCIITRTDHFSYYILCFNYKRLNDQYYCMEEDEPQPNQLDNLFEDHEPLELELVLEQMPEDEVFTVKRRSINEQEGSILPEWGRFHYDESLEQSDIRYLRDTCFPRMSMERVTTQDGALHVRERLNPNEVSLLHIYQSRNVRRR
jgi:beta-xylosidase